MDSQLSQEAAKAKALLDALAKIEVLLDEDERDTVIEGQTDFMEAAARTARMIVEVEALHDAAKAVKASLTSRIDRLETSSRALRNLLCRSMLELQLKTLQLPVATVNARMGKEKLEIDLSVLPAVFKTTELVTHWSPMSRRSSGRSRPRPSCPVPK